MKQGQQVEYVRKEKGGTHSSSSFLYKTHAALPILICRQIAHFETHVVHISYFVSILSLFLSTLIEEFPVNVFFFFRCVVLPGNDDRWVFFIISSGLSRIVLARCICLFCAHINMWPSLSS